MNDKKHGPDWVNELSDCARNLEKIIISSCSFQLNPISKPSVGPGGGMNGAGARSG